MSAETIQILIATCPDTTIAERKLEAVQNARTEQGIPIMDAAVVRRDEHNKLRIHETADVSSGRGAAVGGILGGVLGLIAGPGGVVAGAAVGAIIGGAAAHAFDAGIPHKRLQEIGNALKPEQAALVILTETGYAEFLETLIGGPEIEFVAESIDAQAAEQLGHNHDVALKAIHMGEALADGGMASPTDDKPS